MKRLQKSYLLSDRQIFSKVYDHQYIIYDLIGAEDDLKKTAGYLVCKIKLKWQWGVTDSDEISKQLTANTF